MESGRQRRTPGSCNSHERRATNRAFCAPGAPAPSPARMPTRDRPELAGGGAGAPSRRATCLIGVGSPCILQARPRLCGPGSFDLAPVVGAAFLSQKRGAIGCPQGGYRSMGMNFAERVWRHQRATVQIRLDGSGANMGTQRSDAGQDLSSERLKRGPVHNRVHNPESAAQVKSRSGQSPPHYLGGYRKEPAP